MHLLRVLGSLFCTVALITSTSARANEKMSFSFKNAEMADVIAAYAKASGQKFVVPPGVKGQTTIISPSPISPAEAFILLSAALAQGGFAISRQSDVFVVEQARDTQRSTIEVLRELPPEQPDRQVTLIIKLKYITADEISKQLLRVLPSKYGEMSVVSHNNELMITDFVSSLYRQKRVIDQLDVPAAQEPTTPMSKGTKKKAG